MEKGDARNRLAGIAYEREIVDKINSSGLFPEVGRSAEISKETDVEDKVDIIPINAKLFKDFSYRIQAKSSTKHVAYAKLLEKINTDSNTIGVVLHKKTKAENGRFLTEGVYAILSQKDFFDIIEELERYKKGYREFSQYFDSVHPDEQKGLHERLLKLGL